MTTVPRYIRKTKKDGTAGKNGWTDVRVPGVKEQWP